MQTRYRSLSNREFLENNNHVYHRMVTRSQTQALHMKISKEKEAWFQAYAKKLMNGIKNVDDEYYNESDNIIEKTRIIDELYYNIDKYFDEFMEENPQKWIRFVVAIVDKADELVKEIYYKLHNKGDDRVMEFTRQEKAYLRQVINELKKIKNKYQLLILK